MAQGNQHFLPQKGAESNSAVFYTLVLVLTKTSAAQL